MLRSASHQPVFFSLFLPRMVVDGTEVFVGGLRPWRRDTDTHRRLLNDARKKAVITPALTHAEAIREKVSNRLDFIDVVNQ